MPDQRHYIARLWPRAEVAVLRAELRDRRKKLAMVHATLRVERRRLWVWAHEAQHLRTMLARRTSEQDQMRKALMEIIDHGDAYSGRRAAYALAIRRNNDALVDMLRKDATRV